MNKHGLMLVKKAPVAATAAYDVVREGSTGRVVVMLPRVYAVGEAMAVPQQPAVEVPQQPKAQPKPALAFYRKYTEGLLRRYLRMSTETGRVPSLLGREMFRGNVSHYRVRSFEDVVVFCMDVEKCLAKLTAPEKEVIRRIALQQYTHPESAALLGYSLRHVVRLYHQALDHLTEVLLERRMLEPQKDCQVG